MDIKVLFRYMLLFIFIASGVVGTVVVGKTFFVISSFLQKSSHPNNVFVHYEHVYSSSIREKIYSYVQKIKDEDKEGLFDIGVLCTKTKKEFPIIKKITGVFKSSGILDVFICGVFPDLKVNNISIIGDKRRLFSKIDFDKFQDSLFKEVHINKRYYDDKLALGVYSLLQRIPNDVYEDYKILYRQPTDILLVPKDVSKRYRVVVDEKTLFDEKKRSDLLKIENDVRKKDAQTQKKRGVLTFDIRFKKRILVG